MVRGIEVRRRCIVEFCKSFFFLKHVVLVLYRFRQSDSKYVRHFPNTRVKLVFDICNIIVSSFYHDAKRIQICEVKLVLVAILVVLVISSP